jgi:outer membrane protein assembly factor BamB
MPISRRHSYAPQTTLSATSEVVAIAVHTGEIIWDKHYGSLSTGSPTVVNDLVFTGTLDGAIHASLRDSGEEVWTYQASPDAATAGPP